MKKPKSFEEGICCLEEILAIIADEETPIAQAVTLYAEAASLISYCNTTLQQATLQIEEIDAKFQKENPQSLTQEGDIL